jgi:Protein of unknown function (DUF3108)
VRSLALIAAAAGALGAGGGAAGCGGGDATTGPPRAPAAHPAAAARAEVGLNPGETMAFEVRLAGILAGEAQLAVGSLGAYEGHCAVVVKSRAATAGAVALIRHIVDEATTVIDIDTGRPLALETLVEQGASKITASAKFTGLVADITYQRSGEDQPHTLRLDFAKAVAAQPGVTLHDAISAMVDLRGWRAPPGTRRTVFVVGGRRLWRIDVDHGGHESIGSALGNRRAVRFTGQAYRARRDLTLETEQPTRTFTVWLSDDADRVPLKVVARTELGDVVMDLTEYTRTTEPAASAGS